jgi:type VI secretion system secreted protein VgrG
MPRQLDVTIDCAAFSPELIVIEASVDEALSTPTAARVIAIADEELDAASAVGTPATITVLEDGEAVRYFQLVVWGVRLVGLAQKTGRLRYELDLRSELWLMSLRSDVRWFQQKDAKEIVQEVIDGSEVDAGHFSFSIQRTLAKRTYCVQYRETDFHFVSRLMEHEGVFYFIHDDDSSPNVTFADAQSHFPAIEGDTAVRALADRAREHGITELVFETRVTSASASVGDYNHETPQLDLNQTHTLEGKGFGDTYTYAAGFQTPEEGQALATLRAEEIMARRLIGRGRSDIATFRAGSWFELELASRDGLNGKYLLRSVSHRWVVRPSGDAQRSHYHNSFTCMPHAVTYRPPLRTARPRLRGCHPVTVTGPSGSEIHTDEFGRMKAKFVWDRLGELDDTSSCWMRTAQLPIGGSMTLARVGWEMTVIYFDGNPDRPVGVCRMYTAEKASPYGYPAAKTRMALQTPSSPASGKSNEIRMEDGGGGMEFFVNASKDAESQTNNNKTEDVGVDETIDVGVDRSVTIGVDQTVTIGANQTSSVSGHSTMTVQADRSKSVGASETATISGSINTTIAGSDTETVGASRTTLAALGVSRTATGGQSLTVGGSMLSAAGMGVSLAVAGAKAETIGAAKICASGTSVSETVVGALASTVGGACVQAAGGNRDGSTKGASAITVGGVLAANAAGTLALRAKKISINVLGVANFLGGGGILTLTPGSASMVGMVTVDASGNVKISGNPNLVG